MPSMKPWEREIIEYRPNIGLDTHILSVVKSREDYMAKFQPSAVVNKMTTMLGIDMIESVIASLSRGVHMLNQVEKSLSGDATFEAYRKADEIEAREIYLNHLADLNGNADFDIYPVLASSVQEMEQYLDYLNEELFEGKADFSDLQPAREEEEEYVISLLDTESEDMKLIHRDDLTDEQRALINRMVQDENHPLNSEDEYVAYLNNETRKEGSSRINYDTLINRIQFIATAYEKSNMYKDLMDRTEAYITTPLSSYVHDDLEGSLQYLVDVVDSLSDMKDGLQLSFDYHAKESQNSYVNTLRVSNQDIRTFLDSQLSNVQKKKSQILQAADKLYDPKKYAQMGAQTFMEAVHDAVSSADAMWKYVLTEHIGTSEMNVDQHRKLFDNLTGKRKNQSLYHYVDLVDREFDRENTESELNRFISIHGLHKSR